MLRKIVLARVYSHPAQIQSVTIPARLNGGAGVHIPPPAVVLNGNACFILTHQTPHPTHPTSANEYQWSTA